MNIFDITIGSWGTAHIMDLVDLYLLAQIKDKFSLIFCALFAVKD